MDGPTVYLAHAGVPFGDRPVGPWREVWPLGPDLLLLTSDESLSGVYHALKWELPDDTSLFVAPLHSRPKLKGLPAGTTTWVRDRLPAPRP